MYKIFFKRFIDFFGSLLVLLVISPIMLCLIIWLSIYYKGSPFFTQRRPGLGNKIFNVIKFKSMIDAYDNLGNPLPNKDRITNVGRFLRGTSLDELPQLVNILLGDMSFVGPRPLFEAYLPYYTARELQRHTVRPGVTGLAQVSGRNFLDWDQRLALDVEYSNNISFLNDLKIIFDTIIKVIRSEDISVVPQMKPLHIVRKERTV